MEIPGTPEQGGQVDRLPLQKKILLICSFFNEPFKCALFEGINQKCTWK